MGSDRTASFGRLADLIRPALIARRLQLPISTQIAVYTIERMFDLGAAAILFSSAHLFAPAGLPHREIFIHAGIVFLGLTAFIAMLRRHSSVCSAAKCRRCPGPRHPSPP